MVQYSRLHEPQAGCIVYGMISRTLRLFIAGIFLHAFATAVQAEPDALLQRLESRGTVSDFAGVIDPSSSRTISNLATELRQKTGAEMAVVTIPSLEGGEIDDFGNRLFEKWGIGQRDRDNGLLLLAAMDERLFRIEVGYGLEAIIPDSFAARVRRDIINPNFQNENYGQGLAQSAAIFASRIAQEHGVELSGAPAEVRRYAAKSDERGFGAGLIEIIILIAFVALFIRNPFLAMMLLSGARGGGFRGGGGFGRGGGFGGGLSGGGGSSGRW